MGVQLAVSKAQVLQIGGAVWQSEIAEEGVAI
jgi:hypothetical protein